VPAGCAMLVPLVFCTTWLRVSDKSQAKETKERGREAFVIPFEITSAKKKKTQAGKTEHTRSIGTVVARRQRVQEKLARQRERGGIRVHSRLHKIRKEVSSAKESTTAFCLVCKQRPSERGRESRREGRQRKNGASVRQQNAAAAPRRKSHVFFRAQHVSLFVPAC